MEQCFSYLGYPILIDNSKVLIYNITNGEIIASTIKDYKSTCENLGKIKPLNKSKNSLKEGLNFCLNYTCNLNCEYCSVNANKKNNIISKEIIDAVVDPIIQENRIKELKITFTGGEPTLAIDKIKYVVDKLNKTPFNKTYIINTNGIVNRGSLDYLIKNNFKFFISLDGTKKTHDSQRKRMNGKGSFSGVIQTVKYLISKKADVVLRSTLTKKSIYEFPNVIKLVSKLGIKILRVTNVMECGRAGLNDTKTPSAKEFAEQFHKSLKLARKLGIMLASSQFTNLFTPSIHCCATMAGAEKIITPEGNLTACFASYKENDLYHDFFIYGKYNSETKKFDINEQKQKFLNNYNVEQKKECENCFCKYICSGGCPVVNGLIGKNKNFGSINPEYCEYIKEEIKTLILNEWEGKNAKILDKSRL